MTKKDIEGMYISNFILWLTHRNVDEGHELYERLDEYMEEASTEEDVKYVVLDEVNLEILADDDGYKKIFDSKEEASYYAQNNIHKTFIDAWHVVEIAWHTV